MTMTYRKHIKTILAAAAAAAVMLLAAACGGHKDSGRELFRQGHEAMNKNNPAVAYRQLSAAAAAFGREGDSIGAFEAKANLSLICAMIGQKEEGYRLLKSTPYFHIKREGNYSSQYYLRLMAYYTFTLDGDYATAARYINRLLALDKADYPEKTTWLYMDKANLAEMYLMTGQTAKAWRIIRTLENEPLDDEMYLSQTYYIHALLLEREGKTDSACHYARRSMRYSKEYNAPENEANAMRIIMRRDSARGDVAAYIRQRDAYDSLTWKIRSGEMAHGIAVMKERHKYDLALKEAQRKHAERNLWLAGLTLAAVALCVITLLLYKQNKLKLKSEKAERRRLDQEIEYKRLENELLQLKMKQAQNLLERQRDDNADALRHIAAAEDRKQPKTRLEMLEAQLNTGHAGFIKCMENDYPQLTHNDMLILGFMRMGMTTNETASALGISADSCRKAQYRLRKKLNIDSMEQLILIARKS